MEWMKENRSVTKVTLDAHTCTRLGDMTQCLEFCDETGRTLGYFTPAEDPALYAEIHPPISENELREREAEKGGRSLKQILADLERQG